MQTALAAKTEFLNNMSHEIRTSIQGVSGISEGLDEHWEDLQETKRKELVASIAGSAKRLQSLVGNLLDMSKFTAGKMILSLHKMSLNEAIKDMIFECKTLYTNGKNIEFKFDDDIICSIVADKERLAQVLRNLFVNAIKFSPDQSSITAILRETQNGVMFSIKDEGIGVPEDELSHIFKPFNQSSRTKTKAGGTGLGLSICDEIIKLHNGRIWAVNNTDRGATFSFVIPGKAL